MGHRVFSLDFKKSAVQKLLSRGSRSVALISEDLGVSTPTLYLWKRELSMVGGMQTPSRPQDRSPEEKLKAINEYDSAKLDERGEVLRRLGVHKEHVEAWRLQIYSALKHGAIGKHVQRSERAEDQRLIKELRKDLRRKDTALAEKAALLVLKKKADLIWGCEESE